MGYQWPVKLSSDLNGAGKEVWRLWSRVRTGPLRARESNSPPSDALDRREVGVAGLGVRIAQGDE